MRPKGCVGSSPLSFDKSASLEPAKTGLVAQSAPAIEVQEALTNPARAAREATFLVWGLF
jgi:hypothetical protein